MFKRVTIVQWNRSGGCGGWPVAPGAVWRGLIWALSLTLGAFALLAFWNVVAGGTAGHFAALLTAVYLLAAALGGLAGGNAARRLGWLHGILVGALYGASLFLLALASAAVIPGLLQRLGACIVLGMVGGVAGVNLPVLRRPGRRDGLRRRGM
ncbi:TIGR04086 family membrane protein [Desulfotomaculum copahuensis]|uniref:TIGR04086 family membrane protein n=1 Tax=Desulfotomaculum copahuensis TaxID=1838280 RepID=A0A1B7LF18_9FIRM|nr:TIGR04086 family membrane protein [Desulfotomaculum copahuensis]OAT82218.1 hypothetical protein A6M21_08595 [Desulfotomaculum copahuensis]